MLLIVYELRSLYILVEIGAYIYFDSSSGSNKNLTQVPLTHCVTENNVQQHHIEQVANVQKIT